MLFLPDGAQPLSDVSANQDFNRTRLILFLDGLTRSSRDLDENNRAITGRLNWSMAGARRNDISSQLLEPRDA